MLLLFKTVRPDLLRAFIKSKNSAADTGTNGDAWRKYLSTNGGSGKTLADLERSFLATAGVSSWADYFINQGYTSGVVKDKARKFVAEATSAIVFDDFNDNSISATWSKEGTAAEVLEQNRRMEIAHTATAEYNALATANSFDLTSKTVQVKVTDVGNQSLTSHEVILGVRKDTNNTVWFTCSGGNLMAFKKVATVQTQVGASIAYNSTTHAWWRLRESSGTIFWDTSPDGSTWTNRWSLTNPFAITSVTAAVQSGCWQNEASGSFGYFKNFRIL